MPTVTRTRTLAAAPGAVWQVVGDPRRLAEWWPRVERVEGVDRHHFTEVLRSKRGTLVRADFRRGERVEGRSAAWSQQVEGTAFQRVFASNEIAVELAPADGGQTLVTVTVRQRLQGSARLGGVLVRRANRRQLDAALDALAALHAPPVSA
jgi:carbon monoxide dehydrogenase subunit G